METTTFSRQHGGKTTEKQVLRLYKEGWHIPNIASIAGVKASVVRDILLQRGKDVSEVEQ